MHPQEKRQSLQYDPFPTIGWNGDVTVLSPELAGIESSIYSDFVVGNVLTQSLVDIISASANAEYVKDFFTGVGSCKETCTFFEFCMGGQASNKFFELGTTNGTETTFCRNSKQYPLMALLEGA